MSLLLHDVYLNQLEISDLVCLSGCPLERESSIWSSLALSLSLSCLRLGPLSSITSRGLYSEPSSRPQKHQPQLGINLNNTNTNVSFFFFLSGTAGSAAAVLVFFFLESSDSKLCSGFIASNSVGSLCVSLVLGLDRARLGIGL